MKRYLWLLLRLALTIALFAWLLRDRRVVTIPKAASAAHVTANREAADLVLDEAALQGLERAFPAPRRKRPLEML